MTETEVCRSEDVGEGSILPLIIEGVCIALVRVDSRVYAFEDLCSHMHCALSTGVLTGSAIECDCHGSKFDVRTGEVLSRPARETIRVFAARETSDGAIRVSVI